MNFDAISKNVKILQIGPVEPKLWKIHEITMNGNFEINLEDPSWGLVGCSCQNLIKKCLNFLSYIVNKPPVTTQESFGLKYPEFWFFRKSVLDVLHYKSYVSSFKMTKWSENKLNVILAKF